MTVTTAQLDALRDQLAARHADAEARLALAVWKALRLYLRDVRDTLAGRSLTASAGLPAVVVAALRSAEAGDLGPAALLADAADDQDAEDEGVDDDDSWHRRLQSAGVLPDLAGVAATDDAWARLVRDHVVPTVDDLLGEAFARILADPNTVSARAWQQQYLANVPNRVRGVTAQVFDALRAELQAGIDHGHSIPDIRDAMARVLSTASGGSANTWRTRATVIARTEATRALNGGTRAAWSSRDALTGDSTDKVWVATIDERTRPTHLAADGQQVRMDAQFTVGGSPLDFPGDPTGPSQETVNCRCAMAEVPADGSTPTVDDRQLAGGDDAGEDESDDSDAVTAAAGSSTMPQTWSGLLAPIGVNSGDGRRLAAGGTFTFRPLPLPLMFQESSVQGHDTAVVTARILEVAVLTEAQGDFIPGIYGRGDYLEGEQFAADVAKAVALVAAGLGHVSVDLADVTAELVDGDGKPVSEDELWKAYEAGEKVEVVDQFTVASLIGCTQVSKPAFAEAVIQLGDAGYPTQVAAGADADTEQQAPADTDQAEPAAAAIAEAGVTDRAGTEVVVGARVSVDPDAADDSDDDAVPGEGAEGDDAAAAAVVADGTEVLPTEAAAGGSDDEDAPADGDADGDSDAWTGTVTAVDEAGDTVTVQPDDAEQSPQVVPAGQVTVLADEGTDDTPTPNDDDGGGYVPSPSASEYAATTPAALVAAATVTAEQQLESLRAAAGPVVIAPDPELFANPELSGPTPLTVGKPDANGVRRVYGHVAAWGQCHIGYANRCVTPPKEDDFAFFHVGAVELSDGTELAVGNLTLGGRHADPVLAYRDAVAHYDDSGAGVAAVRAYADEFGIAVAGYITPGTTELQLVELKRCGLSGDWRRIGGALRMAGALAVNTGGFPQPRYAVDGDGRQLSLVAAGMVPQSVAEPESYEQVARRVFAEERDKDRRREQVRALAGQAEVWARRDALAALVASAAVVDAERTERRSALAELLGQVS